MMYKKKQGFTLIELLVVVLIIGILAAVAVPQYQKAVMKSRAVQALLFMRNAGQAMDRWVLENGTPQETIVFTGKQPDGQLDVDLMTSGMTCDNFYCSDGLFTYSVAWEEYYWNASANYKLDPKGTKGALVYTEYEPAKKYLVKACTPFDDESTRFCAALCSLDSGFC